MDETGLSTVTNRMPKVLTLTAKKQFVRFPAERRKTIIAVCCRSATGVPQALIFHRKIMNHLLFKDAPTVTLGLVTKAGYMNSDIFLDWLIHFVHYVKPSVEDQILHIADNHCSLLAIVFLLRVSYHSSTSCKPYHQTLDKGLEVIMLSNVEGIFKEATLLM